MAKRTGLPSAFDTVARVIAIVRPAWDDLGPRRQLALIGDAGRRKLTFRLRPANASPAGTVVSTAISIAKSASIAIAPPCSRPDGLASHSLHGIATVAVPSPISTGPSPVK